MSSDGKSKSNPTGDTPFPKKRGRKSEAEKAAQAEGPEALRAYYISVGRITPDEEEEGDGEEGDRDNDEEEETASKSQKTQSGQSAHTTTPASSQRSQLSAVPQHVPAPAMSLLKELYTASDSKVVAALENTRKFAKKVSIEEERKAVWYEGIKDFKMDDLSHAKSKLEARVQEFDDVVQDKKDSRNTSLEQLKAGTEWKAVFKLVCGLPYSGLDNSMRICKLLETTINEEKELKKFDKPNAVEYAGILADYIAETSSGGGGEDD